MLFVDSTDPKEIEEIFAWGIASGVTTNPLIFAREAGEADLEQRIREVIAVSQGDNVQPGRVEYKRRVAGKTARAVEKYAVPAGTVEALHCSSCT